MNSLKGKKKRVTITLKIIRHKYKYFTNILTLISYTQNLRSLQLYLVIHFLSLFFRKKSLQYKEILMTGIAMVRLTLTDFNANKKL